MAQRFVESEHDRVMLIRYIEEQALPITVSVSKGGKRSVRQNRLNRLWMGEIADQYEGWTPEDARAYCKLTVGVPILRSENDEFRDRYDEYVRPLPYETKIALMREPLDFPVTRLMTVRQQMKYLDQVQQHFSEKGFVLTDPEGILNTPTPTDDASPSVESAPPSESSLADGGAPGCENKVLSDLRVALEREKTLDAVQQVALQFAADVNKLGDEDMKAARALVTARREEIKEMMQ